MNKISLLLIFFIIISSSHITKACPLGIKKKPLGFYEKMIEKKKKFEEAQEEYCLSGGKGNKGKIGKRMNVILERHQVGKCFKDSMNKKTFDKIAGGDFDALSKNMKSECKDDSGAISNELAKKIMQESKGMKQYCKQKSKEKIRQLNNMASIGQYADGNGKNSPFDIVKDMQDISKKIHREKTEYESDEQEPEQSIEDYLEDPFTYMDEYEKRNNKIKTKIKKDKEKKDDEEKGGGDNGLETGNADDENSQSTEDSDTTSTYTNENSDGNEYECISYSGSEKSGLSEDSTKVLLETIEHEPNNRGFVFHFGSGGHIKMPDSNRLTGSGGENPGGDSGDSEGENQDKDNKCNKGYKSVNDKKDWKCNNIICIIIKIVMGQYNPLDYGEGQGDNNQAGKSVENILETSNYHLYKAANTSLAQHKVSTNNFETSYRHLNFGKMLNMSVQISKQPVPNMNLEDDDNSGGGGKGGGNSCK